MFDDFDSDSILPPAMDEFGNPVRRDAKFVVKAGKFHAYRTASDGVRSFLDDACKVDIIIPFHKRYEMVRKTLQTLLWKTRSNPYVVTLVDDGSGKSADEFVETIKNAPNTNIIRLKEQVGFGAAVNAAIKTTNQPFVCILHSDCEIKYGSWLSELGHTLIQGRQHGVGMACARTNNPGDGYEQLKLESLDHATRSEHVISPVALPLYCCMFPRAVLKEVGLFQEYPYTWFENEELFHRMKFYGYSQAVCDKSWVYHHGGGTMNYLIKKNSQVKADALKNRDRCLNDLRALYGNSKSRSPMSSTR